MLDYAPASVLIMLITTSLSLYALYRSNEILYKFILHPYSLVREKKYYTIITSSFLHGDFFHLLFNMLSFYFFGPQIEYWVGTLNFLIIYFGSMIIADIPTILKHKNNYNYRSLGASGAVSGIIFSFIVFQPFGIIYAFFIPMPSIVFAILFLLYGWWMERRGIDFINHSAHNWGAIAGFIITIIIIPGAFNHFINHLF